MRWIAHKLNQVLGLWMFDAIETAWPISALGENWRILIKWGQKLMWNCVEFARFPRYVKPCQWFQKDLGTGVRICRVSVKDLPRACYLSTVVVGKNENSSKLIYSGKNQDNISGKQFPTF